MAEVPSVLFHLERYAELGIAGISIGSNDLTQLLLGADRDSELVAEVFDERDPAVTEYISQLIARARELGLQTSICGQAPSVYPEYAELLVRRRDRRDLGQHRRRSARADRRSRRSLKRDGSRRRGPALRKPQVALTRRSSIRESGSTIAKIPEARRLSPPRPRS